MVLRGMKGMSEQRLQLQFPAGRSWGWAYGEGNTYWKSLASPPASLIPSNSASAYSSLLAEVIILKEPIEWGAVEQPSPAPHPNTVATYHLLDVAVHGVVNNRDLGSHLE